MFTQPCLSQRQVDDDDDNDTSGRWFTGPFWNDSCVNKLSRLCMRWPGPDANPKLLKHSSFIPRAAAGHRSPIPTPILARVWLGGRAVCYSRHQCSILAFGRGLTQYSLNEKAKKKQASYSANLVDLITQQNTKQ